jgi:hypothetical protein
MTPSCTKFHLNPLNSRRRNTQTLTDMFQYILPHVMLCTKDIIKKATTLWYGLPSDCHTCALHKNTRGYWRYVTLRPDKVRTTGLDAGNYHQIHCTVPGAAWRIMTASAANTANCLVLVRFEVLTAVTMKNAVYWDTKTQFVPQRRHVTSPLRS